MKFFQAAAISILSLLTLSQGVVAELTPKQVVDSNTVLISDYHKVYTTLEALTTSSQPVTVSSTEQTVVNDLGRISNHLYSVSEAMKDTPPFTDAEATPIVSSLADYVKIHEKTMSMFISKHPIFAQFAVTSRILNSLRALESTIDAFGFAMLDLIPTRTSEVTQDKNSLDSSIITTIQTYEQVCLPSPLYPIVLPVCNTV